MVAMSVKMKTLRDMLLSDPTMTELYARYTQAVQEMGISSMLEGMLLNDIMILQAILDSREPEGSHSSRDSKEGYG